MGSPGVRYNGILAQILPLKRHFIVTCQQGLGGDQGKLAQGLRKVVLGVSSENVIEPNPVGYGGMICGGKIKWTMHK